MEEVSNIFFGALFVNTLYEVLHSPLYLTCRRASAVHYAYLMLKGAFFDAFFIAFLYQLAGGNIPIFLVLAIALAWGWEIYSLKNKRWEYANSMPIVFGVGLTPFLQLALTGIITIYIV